MFCPVPFRLVTLPAPCLSGLLHVKEWSWQQAHGPAISSAQPPATTDGRRCSSPAEGTCLSCSCLLACRPYGMGSWRWGTPRSGSQIRFPDIPDMNVHEPGSCDVEVVYIQFLCAAHTLHATQVGCCICRRCCCLQALLCLTVHNK